MPLPNSNTNQQPDPEIVDSIRGFISLVIVIHLLGLVLMFWSNPLQPEQQALVVTRARRVFDNYMLPLLFDRGWGMRLTSSEDMDSDHFLQIITKDKDSNIIANDLRLPSLNAKFPEERERWQRVAAYVATHLDNPHVDSIVNEIGKQLLVRLKAENSNIAQLEIECRRRIRVPFTLDEENINGLDPRWISDPVYVAFVAEDGFWRKSLDRRDYAPVIKDAPATQQQSNPTGTIPPAKSESQPQ